MATTNHLLLLHGALGSSAGFKGLIAALEPHFTVHAMDFEGHGPRAHSGREFRIQHFAENVVTYLDEQGIEAANIFGYSMGGYVALYLASVMPGRVRGIATLATKFNWTPETAAREAAMLDAEKMLEKVPAFAQQLNSVHTGYGWKEVVAETRSLLMGLGDVPVVSPELLAAVSCPVRVMVGDRDAMVSLDETREAYGRLPNAELAVLPGTKHPLEKVDAELLASTLRQFFAK